MSNEQIYLKSLMGGIFIGLAAVVYSFVSQTNSLIASCLFAFALTSIFELKLLLFTGRIGFLRFTDWVEALIIFFGNLMGVQLVGALMMFTQHQERLCSICTTICNNKLSGTPLAILILSFFCGFLMHTAAICKKDIKESIKYLLIILCVVIFIQSCYEHVIANLFYYFMSGQMFTLQGAQSLILMVIGNTLGAKFMNDLYKAKERTR